MAKFFILILLCINTFFANTQDTLKKSFTYSFGMNRMDFFTGINYSLPKRKITYNLGFEFGVNRTIFQNRFFPRISTGLEFRGIQKSMFHLTPVVNYSISMVNINKKNNDVHFFNELYLGYNFTVGKKFKFYQSTQAGWMSESFQSSFDNQVIIANLIGYFIKIGLKHEI